MNLHDHGGALDALANYHFSRIDIADAGSAQVGQEREARQAVTTVTSNVPEFCMSQDAEGALELCLRRRGIAAGFFGSGFEFGLYAARIIMKDPFGCEATLRAMLDKKAQELKIDGAPAPAPVVVLDEDDL